MLRDLARCATYNNFNFVSEIYEFLIECENEFLIKSESELSESESKIRFLEQNCHFASVAFGVVGVALSVLRC